MNGYRWHAAAVELAEWVRSTGPRIALAGGAIFLMVAVRHSRVAVETKPEWLELAEAAILYFGVTLLPLLIVILLY